MYVHIPRPSFQCHPRLSLLLPPLCLPPLYESVHMCVCVCASLLYGYVYVCVCACIRICAAAATTALFASAPTSCEDV